MSGRLQREIKQRRPFRRLEEEAYLTVMKTADAFDQAAARVLKPYGISQTQYNVLRILRGAEPQGLTCREMGERMITRDPDITRLLDRLEARELIARRRADEDRRVVKARVTEAGLALLAKLDQPVDDFLRDLLSRLGAARLRSLIELLEEARARHRH